MFVMTIFQSTQGLSFEGIVPVLTGLPRPMTHTALKSYKQSQVCLFVYMDGIGWQSRVNWWQNFEGNAPVKQHGDTDPAWGGNYRNEIISNWIWSLSTTMETNLGTGAMVISSNIAWILRDIRWNLWLQQYGHTIQHYIGSEILSHIILLHTCLHNLMSSQMSQFMLSWICIYKLLFCISFFSGEIWSCP